MKFVKWIKRLFRKIKRSDSTITIDIKCETSDAIRAIKKTECAISYLTKAMENFGSVTEDALYEFNNLKDSIKDYEHGKTKNEIT